MMITKYNNEYPMFRCLIPTGRWEEELRFPLSSGMDVGSSGSRPKNRPWTATAHPRVALHTFAPCPDPLTVDWIAKKVSDVTSGSAFLWKYLSNTFSPLPSHPYMLREAII